MGAPKLKPEERSKSPQNNSQDNIQLKSEVERLRKLLEHKLRDQQLAKKAAMIISEMLDKK